VPQNWDWLFKRAFELAPNDMLAVCGIATEGLVVEALMTEYLTEVRADRVFRVGDRIVHIEIQSYRGQDLERRLVRYWAAIDARHGKAPHQVVLLPRGGDYVGHFVSGRLRLDYDVVDLTKADPQVLRSGTTPTLSLFGTTATEELVSDIAAQIPDLPEPLQQVNAELGLLAIGDDQVLSDRFLLELRRHGMSMIEQTTWGREMIAKGREEGRREGQQEGRLAGREEGMERGLERGLVRGMEEGLEQGQIAARSEMALALLNRRFGTDPRIANAVAALRHLTPEAILTAVESAERIEDLYES